jgi:hydrogenase maturation protein HypF
MALEAAVDPRVEGVYPFGEDLTGDWEPLLDAIGAERRRGVAVGAMAARFHRTLVGWICRAARQTGLDSVVLSGGAFQNAFLCDQAVAALTAAGHTPYSHHRVPANDGGLALGQLVLSRAAAAME